MKIPETPKTHFLYYIIEAENAKQESLKKHQQISTKSIFKTA